jgi:hypothetical protein
MPTWQAIQSRQHINSGWRPPTDYRHAKEEALAPVTITELSQAIPHYAMAFRELSDGYQLVAILSLQSGVNLYVGADNRWQASFVPACFRSYPFNLLPNKQGTLVVCIDLDSGLFHEQAEPEDKPIFNADGEPTEAVQEVITFMQQRHKQQAITQKAVNKLAENNLIEPWPVQLRADSGEVQNVTGLFRIAESKIKSLGPDALSDLVQHGALALAYAQLFSMPNFSRLGELAKYHAQQAQQSEQPDIDQLFGSDDTLHFDNI